MSHTVHAIITVVQAMLPGETPAPGGQIPIFSDPPASAPAELSRFGSKVFGFIKAISLVVGVIMFGFAWLKVMLGKSRRQDMAAEGMHHAVYVIGALGGLFMTIPIVSFFANW
ncbi:hypothetical protein [Nonomuraea sp. NPDC049784]|uniref:hypothetical protein n=1 Tax=Nonomuraea sp. NPDC049784 TaxID=3154361 RepID=UPI003403D14C